MAKLDSPLDLLTHSFDRRKFLGKSMAAAGLGISSAAMVVGFPASLRAQDGDNDDQGFNGLRDTTSHDTARQIFTAALIAEDLASTFYYNGIISLAAGLAEDDQSYLKAALSEEVMHAGLFRSLLQRTPSTGSDPVQTFYFPTGTFNSLSSFLPLLDALENAFIGAYLKAVKEFAQMAADTKAGAGDQLDLNGKPFKSTDLEYFAEVAASILGVEAEHRVLGRVIGSNNPPNNHCYEQTDGILTVFNGSASAAAALAPFLSAGSGKTGFSLATALAKASSVDIPCTGGLPPT